MPVSILRSPRVDSAVKCLNTLAPMDKPNLLVTQEGKVFKVSVDKDAILKGLRAGSNGVLNALHAIRSAKIMSYENCNRVRKFKQDLDFVSLELGKRRDNLYEQAASKYRGLRYCYDYTLGVSSLIRLATQAEKLTKVKGEFIRHLLSWLKTANEDDIKKTSLESFSDLKRLIAHAKGDSLCSSYDELFDKLHLECFEGVCGTDKHEIVEFFGRVNMEIKNGEYDAGYILGDFLIQRKIFPGSSVARPSEVNKWYEETKVNKIKTAKLDATRIKFSSNFKALKAFINDLLDKQSLEEIKIRLELKRLEAGLFEGFKKLRILDVSLGGVEEVEPGFIKDCPSLEKLNFCNCKELKKLPKGMLKGLESLKNVILTGSGIEEIEPGFVKECPSLEELNFTSCKGLKKLPKGMLKGLESLKNVVFYMSGIEEVEPGFVKECPSLELIDFGYCKELKKLPKGMFEGCEKLRKLKLIGGEVKEIMPGFVKDCPSLEKLEFYSFKELKKLPKGMFEGCMRLKDLSFTGAGIEEIEPGFIKECSSLEELSFFDCKNLKKLTKGMFEGLKGLKVLKFCGSEVEEVESSSVKACLSLEELNFSFCKSLKKLTKGMFEGLKRLRKLNFEYSKVKEVESGFVKECPSLEELNFTSCQGLKKLPTGMFKDLGKLKIVDFSHSAVEEVEPGWIEGCPSLEKIQLYKCKEVVLEESLRRFVVQDLL